MKLSDLVKENIESPIEDAAQYALTIMKNARESARGAQIDPPEQSFGGLTFGIRHWGQWEMPEGEEDDGDYDWEMLSEASARKLDEYLAMCEKNYPKFKFTPNTGEKNWIYISVRPK